jgi:hypothetical protein
MNNRATAVLGSGAMAYTWSIDEETKAGRSGIQAAERM